MPEDETLQKFTCPECGTEFEAEIEGATLVNVSLKLSSKKESRENILKKKKKVIIYLTCPKDHTNPYSIEKSYK